jgi:hypothetical protein
MRRFENKNKIVTRVLLDETRNEMHYLTFTKHLYLLV